MAKGSKHIGSKFDDFLKKELKNPEFKEEYEKVRMHLSIGKKVRKIAKREGLTVRSLAEKMDTSISQVNRLMTDANVSLETLSRFAAATGSKLNVELR